MEQESIREVNENSSKITQIHKLLLLVSILLPLLVLSQFVASNQKEDILNFIRLDESALIEEVQTSLFTLQTMIQTNKILLSPYSSWQLSVDQAENRREQEIQRVFFKQIKKLKQSKLKYFRFADLDNSDSKEVSAFKGEQIQIYNVQQVEQVREIQQLNRKVKEKSYFEVADNIVFSVNMMQVDQFRSPISKTMIHLIQKQIINHLIKNSLISPFLKTNNTPHYSPFNQAIQIQVLIKSSHISEIQQNSRKKLQSIFNHQNSLISESSLSKNSNLALDDFYVQQVLEDLQRNHIGEECNFEMNYTECKQFQLLVLYKDGELVDDRMSDEQVRQEISDISEEQNDIIQENISQRLDSLNYWTKQDKSISLTTFHPFTTKEFQPSSSSSSSSTSYQVNQLMLNSLLTQLIYQQVGLSPLILLTKDRWWFDHTQKQRLLKIQSVFSQFVQLNQFYKLRSSLQHISRILSNQSELIYEPIDDHVRNNLNNLLQKVQLHANDQQSSNLSISNTFTSHIINSINSFDPFPFDYKLGALIPIAIILLYPLIGFFGLLFK